MTSISYMTTKYDGRKMISSFVLAREQKKIISSACKTALNVTKSKQSNWFICPWHWKRSDSQRRGDKLNAKRRGISKNTEQKKQSQMKLMIPVFLWLRSRIGSSTLIFNSISLLRTKRSFSVHILSLLYLQLIVISFPLCPLYQFTLSAIVVYFAPSHASTHIVCYLRFRFKHRHILIKKRFTAQCFRK